MVEGGVRTSYRYDPVGNRLERRRGPVVSSYGYDKADRLTRLAEAGVPVPVGNDANGNLTQKGLQTLGYDQANRLTRVRAGATLAQYLYEGDGKRAAATIAGVLTTSYTYDANAGLPLLLQQSGSGKRVPSPGQCGSCTSCRNA